MKTGTGLGLSIIHSIIEKHQEKLSIISEPGNGAEFSLSIPLNC
ncbi:MAG: ATP-binding protein [Nostoc sp.]